MAIIANLTGTPIPSTSLNGAVPGTLLDHVTVTSAGGAGTYTFTHLLQWTPTFCLVVPQIAEGTTPTTSNSSVAFCKADTTSTVIAFNLPGNGTFDLYYI